MQMVNKYDLYTPSKGLKVTSFLFDGLYLQSLTYVRSKKNH